MSRLKSLPIWAFALLGTLAVAISLRALAAIESGATPLVAIRTYIFWALVCAPVAMVADILVRDIMNYRLVRVAVARVKNRR